jgi:hypothetical protein
VVILDEQVRLIYLNQGNFFVRILREFFVEWNHHLLKYVLMLNTNKFEKLLIHSKTKEEYIIIVFFFLLRLIILLDVDVG